MAKPVRIRSLSEEEYSKLDSWTVGTFHRVSVPEVKTPVREPKKRGDGRRAKDKSKKQGDSGD